jgi:hypothetical protein
VSKTAVGKKVFVLFITLSSWYKLVLPDLRRTVRIARTASHEFAPPGTDLRLDGRHRVGGG